MNITLKPKDQYASRTINQKLKEMGIDELKLLLKLRFNKNDWWNMVLRFSNS